MARWDEILTLPVQNPPALEFSAADIMWSRVEGWRDSMDRLALIPFSRVNDFVRGESNNKECPTRFHVEARRRRTQKMDYKPKVDGILEYILYWCSFGPDDHRKGGAVRPSRTYTEHRKTPAGRPNTKRGCVCHFIVKRLIAEPSVALIIYNHNKHVDKKGLPCHGPMDKKAAGTKAMFAPYISDELRLQVMSLLYVGVPVETIMQRHTEMVEKQGGPSNRDDLLTHRYVRRLELKIRRAIFELDTDDAVSVNTWVETHQDHIFFYEDFSDGETFLLGIQTEWQLQQMIQFSNRSLLASDSKFGTNKLMYPVHSILVFDKDNNAIPVAWIISPTCANGDIHRWMRALFDRVRTKDPTWQLGGFIVDDPLADINTIREVFQCSVLISFWRVRHAWHKHLMDKCLEIEMRAMIARRLGETISNICKGNGDVDLFEAFLEDFVDCSDFLDYFKAIWFPRLGAWITALKALPFASSEVSAAIESYHHLLKLRLLNEKDESVYRRADWLVDKLGTKVHSYYWLDEYSGKDGFSRYWKNEWKSCSNPWRQAFQIPDSDVVVAGDCAKVVCQKNKEKLHAVTNPGYELALCDCSWSRMGNLCKHAIKSTKVYRDRGMAPPSLALFRYNQALVNILYCPPHDSVIRDHAIALAVCVKAQLDALYGTTNGNCPPFVSTSRDHRASSKLRASSVEKLNNDGFVSASQCQPASDDRNEALTDKSSSAHNKRKAGEAFNDHEETTDMQRSRTCGSQVPSELNNASIEGGCIDNESANSRAINSTSDNAHNGQVSGHEELSEDASDACLERSSGIGLEQPSIAKSNVPLDNQRISDTLKSCTSDLMIVDSTDASTSTSVIYAKKLDTSQNCHEGSVEGASPGQNNNDKTGNSRENECVTNEATAAGSITCRKGDKSNEDILADNSPCDPSSNKLDCNREEVPDIDLKPCSILTEITGVDSNDAANKFGLVDDTRDVLDGHSCIASGETAYTEKLNIEIVSGKVNVDKESTARGVEHCSDFLDEVQVPGDSTSVGIDVDRGTAVA